MKTCSCGKTYSRLESWQALPLCGQLDTGFEVIELRNCSCGSTIGIQIKGETATELDLAAAESIALIVAAELAADERR